MSNLSIWLKRNLGVPEVKLANVDDTVGAIAEQVAKGKSAEIARRLPDVVFDSLYLVFKDEALRRGKG